MNRKKIVEELRNKADSCDIEYFEWRVADNRELARHYEIRAEVYREVIRMLEGKK